VDRNFGCKALAYGETDHRELTIPALTERHSTWGPEGPEASAFEAC